MTQAERPIFTGVRTGQTSGLSIRGLAMVVTVTTAAGVFRVWGPLRIRKKSYVSAADRTLAR